VDVSATTDTVSQGLGREGDQLAVFARHTAQDEARGDECVGRSDRIKRWGGEFNLSPSRFGVDLLHLDAGGG
jgi:hypothetical protein